ncbi:MAG: endonuclease/exonuclease/phosphatase family protein [Dehalococcoidia bacterium]|nr:endonuclease/exonuclease/phosphatase family protein [Dehalococcoidia bacterium]
MTTVTVATLNLYNKVGRWGERQPLVAEQLAELLPDVVGLQEVDLIIDQGMSLCRLVNARLTDRPRYRVYHMGRPGRAAHVQAIAVMSRLPVERHEGLDYLMNEGVAQRMRIRLDGGATLDFYNTHLFFPPEATEERSEQGRKLLAWAETWNGADATVVAGDFNAYPGEPVLALMKERFVSAHEAVHGCEPERTWPTPINDWDPSPPGCLDYIFVDGARVVDAGVAIDKPHPLDATLYPSDHVAVTAKLELG